MNRSKARKPREPNPISKAAIFSRMTFWWLKPLFKIGLNRGIVDDDIYAVTNDMRSDQNAETYARLWKAELLKKNPSILNVILKVHGYEALILGVLFSLGETTARVIQPICVGGFVTYFAEIDGNQVTLNDAYWYATGIVLSTVFLMSIFHPICLYLFKTSWKIRTACSGIIYQKALRLTKSMAEDGQNGKIINLLSNDLAKFDNMIAYFHEIWKGPLEAFVFLIVMYTEIGIAAVVGMAFLLSFIPLQAWIGKKSAELRLKNIERTDFRVNIMNEILLGIQVIKMYAWEKSFAKLVNQIRRKEVNSIRSIAYIRATISSLPIISKVSVFLSLISYVFFGNVIDARKVFIVSSYFDTLNKSIVYYWPLTLTFVAEGVVSLQRLQELLLRPESKDLNSFSKTTRNEIADLVNANSTTNERSDGMGIFNKSYQKYSDAISYDENGISAFAYNKRNYRPAGQRIQNINSTEKFIRLENVTAMWLRQMENNQTNGIFDVTTEIKSGLCAIVGQVGSGKSTLLNVILGELSVDVGTITINGSISFASQEPWLFDSTVRDNIVFVEEFDAKRYKKVVEVCALKRDFELLPKGDATIVGERGLSLSGGQRARINLARAIYKKADIYFLDDPLSAVDSQVGKHIFERCITEFLANKICVLVTHQLQYLKSVNHVILMTSGKIESEGSFDTLPRFNKESLLQSKDYSKKLAFKGIQERARRDSTASSLLFDDEVIEDEPIDRIEQKMTGSVQMGTYAAFFKAVQSNLYIAVVVALFILNRFILSGADYFLSEWVDWEEDITNVTEKIDEAKRNITENHIESIDQRRGYFILVYTCVIVLGIIFTLGHSFGFYAMCLRVSVNFHDMIFNGISRAKMIFFNNNPGGRIINRFARDIGNVDTLLPIDMLDVFDCLLMYLSIVIMDGMVNPWLLIPAVVMTILFYLMRIVYIKTGRDLKRIEAMNRGPVFSHLNATLHGLPTIRVFNASKKLEKEFHEFQDYNTSSYFLLIYATRCFAMWLDFVCTLFIAFVTYSFFILPSSMEVQSGQVGLVVTISINLIGTCEWGMRQSAELENQMTSVERIVEYAQLPSEPALESDVEREPPYDWPFDGNIQFKSLSFRYDENGPQILRNLSFQIDGKQKVGIVGRTGAGKSSIIQSIFRLAQNEGHILIDGIDIGLIGLHDLRKNISIIPQEPVLFSGSLRFNLDPFGDKTDDELWDSLEQVELKAVVAMIPGGIDSNVQDGGSNYSVGQRQLLCLARAILRNNKILILDEATANVDTETDALIQQTIRHQFADCTVITIAHRLHTIMDSDKVLVVDAGEVKEFQHPFELASNPNSIFKQLLDQTENPAALMQIAKENYERYEPKDILDKQIFWSCK